MNSTPKKIQFFVSKLSPHGNATTGVRFEKKSHGGCNFCMLSRMLNKSGPTMLNKKADFATRGPQQMRTRRAAHEISEKQTLTSCAAHCYNSKNARTLKKLLPGKLELVILLGLVAISTAIVAILPTIDLSIAGASVPVFLVASILGLRRHWQLTDGAAEAPD